MEILDLWTSLHDSCTYGSLHGYPLPCILWPEHWSFAQQDDSAEAEAGQGFPRHKRSMSGASVGAGGFDDRRATLLSTASSLASLTIPEVQSLYMRMMLPVQAICFPIRRCLRIWTRRCTRIMCGC